MVFVYRVPLLNPVFVCLLEKSRRNFSFTKHTLNARFAAVRTHTHTQRERERPREREKEKEREREREKGYRERERGSGSE